MIDPGEGAGLTTLNGCGLECREALRDVNGSTYNPEHTQFAAVARKRQNME